MLQSMPVLFHYLVKHGITNHIRAKAKAREVTQACVICSKDSHKKTSHSQKRIGSFFISCRLGHRSDNLAGQKGVGITS